MPPSWPKGSEWRKWDLHLHSPGTKLNDGFRTEDGKEWEVYCKTLHESDVQVFGITDYFSADGYFATLKEFKARHAGSTKLLMPNIELRTGDVVNRAQEEVNVHLIFNPFQSRYEDNIRLFLQNLKTNKTVEADRRVKASELSETREFAEATTTREFILDALIEVFGKKANLADHVLIVTAANNDGLRPERGKMRKELITDELDKFSNGFFGNAGNVPHYLRTDRFEDKNEPSKPKPTLSGSDAHSFGDLQSRLGKTVLDGERAIFQPTWIKADPTFDGLKQIIFEPSARVHIGDTAPQYHDRARVIRSVTLSHSNGWFEDVEIPLNSGLVSVIGQKGSGKSALAELIAYAAGSWDTTEPSSFLHRASAHIRDLVVTLNWTEGSPTRQRIGDQQSNEKRVRYLSQKFVERLCATDHLAEELIREIENVIFEHTDPTDTMNASDFGELRAAKTEGIRADRERLREDVVRLIREELALRGNRAKRKDKEARIKVLKEEAAGLEKQMPKPATEEEKKVQEALQTKRSALAILQQEVGGYKQKVQKILDIGIRVTAFKSQISKFETEVGAMLKDAGVPDGEAAAFTPKFSGDTDAPLKKRTGELQSAIASKEGTVEKPAAGTIRAIEQEIKALVEKESTDKARQKQIKTIQTRLAAIATEIKKLTDEIEHIDGPEKARLIKARQERLEAYGGYFENLKLEQKALEELYKPVKKKLKGTGGKDQELEFSIRWNADVASWVQRGVQLFDQRRANPYGTVQQLTDAANRILLPAWTEGDTQEIKVAFEEFMGPFREMPPADYMRTDVTLQDVFEWLYEVQHVRLDYGLTYNKTDLSKLSPGTKGIVLLILYLGMDTEDTRPLIVDQPDENLDNESIYDLLRMYFQNAKTRRQIILISHNPNLVVNADSEQVIVATCTRREDGLPFITYQMGSLENSNADGSGIRQRACRILEGGDVAFQRRESRYSIQRSVVAADERT
jgi:energy-coupling factor transporter ATP-binding protein EcfA2